MQGLSARDITGQCGGCKGLGGVSNTGNSWRRWPYRHQHPCNQNDDGSLWSERSEGVYGKGKGNV